MRVKKAAEVRIATLLFKPDAFRGNYDIDYVGKEIPNDFIVGFGLDYNQNGRNYKDIYKVVQ
jgi:hypoxanthine phosphoribosyltransferase